MLGNAETFASPEDRQRCAYYPTRFFTKPKMDKHENVILDAAGNPTMEDWVECRKKGDPKSTYVEAVHRLQRSLRRRPGAEEGQGADAALLWRAIQPAYEAWKHGQEEPAHGTPLSVWPGLSEWQTETLKQMGLRTVEDVAAMTDADMQRFGMGGPGVKAKAQAFVANKPRAADAQRMTDLEAANKRQADELAAMRVQLQEIAAQKAAAAQPAADPPKRPQRAA